jgi:hydroxymethylglutaryl-CoA lyase
MNDLPERLSLREVGPRDGLQNEDPVPTEAKVALIDALSRTGVSRIEAVSFVHPKAIPQMADAAEVWSSIVRNPDVRYSALVPNLVGAQRALDAGFTEIEVVVSASDTHNRKNVNRSTGESIEGVARVLERARAEGLRCEGVVSTAFGCPYEGWVDPNRVAEIARALVDAGAQEVGFGDTTGMANPRQVGELFACWR